MVRRLGQLFLSGIFLKGGWDTFMNPGKRPEKVAAAGIPEPELAVEWNGLGMLVGGFLLGLGIFPKLAALLLVGTLVPTTYVGHPFWKEEPGPQRKAQTTQFLKNLGLIGGLLLVLSERK